MNGLNNKLQTIQQRINAGERSTASYVLIRRDLWVKLNSGAKNSNTIRRLKRRQMSKQYRIKEKIHGEGTKYQSSKFYPQVMDPQVLNQPSDIWENYVDSKYEGESVWFTNIQEARTFIDKQKAKDLPIKTIIHQA